MTSGETGISVGEAEPKQCPSCGSAAAVSRVGKIPSSDVFAGRPLVALIEGGYLYVCRECYLLFKFPVWPASELDELYRNGSEGAWQSDLAGRADWRIAEGWIRGLLPQGSSILDVGCFDGGFLSALSSNYQCYGVEIQESAREKARARRIELVGRHHEVLNRFYGRFDGIVSFDLIEHVRNPAAMLSMLSKALRPSGILIMSSGNSQAWTWRLMGSRYWYCALAEHISFISPRWCDAVSSGVGLRIERQQRFSHARMSLPRKLGETAKNFTYRAMPHLTAWLRERGFGSKDAQHFHALSDYPPAWMSARDHFIFLGRKNTDVRLCETKST